MKTFTPKLSFIALIAALSMLALSCDRVVSDEEYKSNYAISNIRIMNIDGTNERALTNDENYVLYANFLPNGQKIVFVQTGGLSPDVPLNSSQTLYTMNVDGTGMTPILSKNICLIGTVAPLWLTSYKIPRILFTKDSRKIIFSTASDIESCSNIYSVNVDGSDLVNITGSDSYKVRFGTFSLSSDDRTIVYNEFHTDTTGGDCLSMRNIDGSNYRVIKTFAGTKPLYPQFLPADTNTVLYFETEGSPSPLLKKISVSDPSKTSVVSDFPSLTYQPVLCSNKMVVYAGMYPDAGLYAVDVATGAKQLIYRNVGAWVVSASPDKQLLTWSDASRFGILRSDGTVVRDSLRSVTGTQCQEPYLSPSNQQVVFRAISQIRK